MQRAAWQGGVWLGRARQGKEFVRIRGLAVPGRARRGQVRFGEACFDRDK